MQFVRADPNLRPKPELPTIIKPRRRIVHHHRRIHLLLKPRHRPQILRHNPIRVVRPILIDVRNRLIQPRNRLHS